MDALKKSMQARGQTKVRDAVRGQMGKKARVQEGRPHLKECQADKRRKAVSALAVATLALAEAHLH